MPRPFCSFSSSVCCLRPQAAVCRARSFQHTKRSLSQRVRRQPGRIPLPATRAVWQSADSQLEAIRLKQSDADDRKWLQRLWATIDVTATLGSVCGAVAFIILEEAWLMGLPVILPLIALFANRQREKVSLQEAIARATGEAMRQVGQIQQEAAAEAAAEVAEQVMADQQAATLQTQQMLRQLRQELRQQLPGTGMEQSQAFQRLEVKLSALEGSVLSAGSVAREAARAAAEAGSSLSGDAREQLEQASLGVARELRGELQRGQSDTSRALSQIQPRLQAMEGAMVGLQEAQVESMRRLTAGLTDAIGEAQLTLQAAVRAEAHASLEPVRRLPQVLAAALPLTDVTIGQVAQAGPLECALSSGERDWLQTTMKQQLEAASEQIIASQTQELTGLKDIRRSGPETVTELRSSLAPQLARINRGLQELAAFQADVGGRMDNRAVLQRLDILQSSFESAVKQAAPGPSSSRPGSTSAPDPNLLATVQTLEQSLTSLLDQVEDGRDASLELAEETAALREQLQSMQQLQPPDPPQEAKDGPVVQEAVMALARAVQQLESRSLSRLEELKAQLRPPRPMSQTNSPAASASGAASAGGSRQEVTDGNSPWAASLSHAADVSSRLAQQVDQTSGSASETEQAPGPARPDPEEAALQELQQLLQSVPEAEQEARLLEPHSELPMQQQQQQQQFQGSPEPNEAGRRSQPSPRERENRSLPNWLQPAPDLGQEASTSQLQSDRQLQEQLQQRLQSSGAELDGRNESQHGALDPATPTAKQDALQPASLPPSGATLEAASGMTPGPLSAEDDVTRDAAFQRMQALLASQNGWARSDSNSAEADATRPQLSPGTASEALEETESKPSSLGSSKGDGQTMSEEAGRDRDAGAEGQGRPKEPLDNREQGRDFAGWLRGRPSDASPLLVDELRFAAGLAHGEADESQQHQWRLSDESSAQSSSPADAYPASASAASDRRMAVLQSGPPSTAADEPADSIGKFSNGSQSDGSQTVSIISPSSDGPTGQQQQREQQVQQQREQRESAIGSSIGKSEAQGASRQDLQSRAGNVRGMSPAVEGRRSGVPSKFQSAPANAAADHSAGSYGSDRRPGWSAGQGLTDTPSFTSSPLPAAADAKDSQGSWAGLDSGESELEDEEDSPWDPTANDAADSLQPDKPVSQLEQPSSWGQSMTQSPVEPETYSASGDPAAGMPSRGPSSASPPSRSPSMSPENAENDANPGGITRDPWRSPSRDSSKGQGMQQGAEGPGRTEVREGKRLLAEGRAARREGLAWGRADQALAGACAAFQTAAKADPDRASILGNWGNALMEYGQLKADYRGQVASTAAATVEEEQALLDASENLRCEATDLLRLAGRRYKRAFEIAEGAGQRHDSNRALQNWMQSIILRAGLAAEPEEAQRLYENACEKAKALLEDEPENVAAWRACSQALLQLSLLLQPSQPAPAQECLQDAETCLLRVLELGGEDSPLKAEVRAQLHQLQDLATWSPGKPSLALAAL